MLGNITLVYPLERLYSSTFQKKWDRTLEKVRLISPGDLEEMDEQVKKLERYYDLSGMSKLSRSLGTYPDAYSSKINVLKSNVKQTIAEKFSKISKNLYDLIGDYESLHDFEQDRKDFDEALVKFRMLRAFYRRWKMDGPEYLQYGSKDYKMILKELAFRLARKRMLLMKEHGSMQDILDYRKRLKALDAIDVEVSKLLGWYGEEYLNIDGTNPSWIGADVESGESWMQVTFIDDDNGIAPLERLRKVPSPSEVDEVRALLDRFVMFYSKNDILDISEVGVLSDYLRFRNYAANFSLDSDDSDERLKAGLMAHISNIHDVLRDAEERIKLKTGEESLFENSFVMYSAPVDEIHAILQRGFISAEHAIQNKLKDGGHGNLTFRVGADIVEGDVGFIFPLTKVLEGHRFHVVNASDSESYLHVFSKAPDVPLQIDIRKGIFIAPKNNILRYRAGSQLVRESSEQYFRRFFSVLSNQGSGWFESDRLSNWLSRHCMFYDDRSRKELVSMLRNKSFVSVMNRFTNKMYDNLALSPVDGVLVPTNYYVPHAFDELPQSRRALLPPGPVNVTLFEWVPVENKSS
ncbi:MAG: hypothetical protein V1729_06770 [Candidatus Woesearchaeota archaeon]